jgi:hypothetical protein
MTRLNGIIERNIGVPPERRIEFRIGIHLVDVMEESDGDLLIPDVRLLGPNIRHGDRRAAENRGRLDRVPHGLTSARDELSVTAVTGDPQMLRVLRLIVICLTILGVLAGGHVAAAQQQTVIVPTLSQQIDGARIGWIVNDLGASFGRAMKDGKPVVVFFTSAVNCNWCKKYVANVLSCPTLNTLAGRAHFVFAGWSSNETRQLMIGLGINSVPIVSVLRVPPDKKVEEIVRGTGFTDEAGLLGILAQAKLAPTPPNRLPQASVALGTYLPQGCGLRGHSDAEIKKMSWPETITVPGL